MPSHDVANFLAGSPDRLRLLSHLRNRPGSPGDLADALPMSHRSIQRNLAAFADRGWAEKRDGAYRLTPIGVLVTERHAAYIDTLDTLAAFAPFYRYLPDREHAPDPEWLADAQLIEATAENPQAPVQHYIQAVKGFETERVRMVSPVLSRLFHGAHADLAFRGVHTELVLSAALVQRARDLNSTEFNVVVSVDVLDVYQYPDEIGFGLTLGDRQVLMGAYDDQGQLKACLDSTDPAFLAWAERLFERYRGESERIEPTFRLPFTLGKR
jgi:predicted transcriptional regulator